MKHIISGRGKASDVAKIVYIQQIGNILNPTVTATIHEEDVGKSIIIYFNDITGAQQCYPNLQFVPKSGLDVLTGKVVDASNIISSLGSFLAWSYVATDIHPKYQFNNFTTGNALTLVEVDI